jgi:hypothetical protein
MCLGIKAKLYARHCVAVAASARSGVSRQEKSASRDGAQRFEPDELLQRVDDDPDPRQSASPGQIWQTRRRRANWCSARKDQPVQSSMPVLLTNAAIAGESGAPHNDFELA